MGLVAETERLEIVSFSPSDATVLHELTRDADVMRYFRKVLSYDETSEMLQKILDQYRCYSYCFLKAMLRGENRTGRPNFTERVAGYQDYAPRVRYRLIPGIY